MAGLDSGRLARSRRADFPKVPRGRPPSRWWRAPPISRRGAQVHLPVHLPGPRCERGMARFVTPGFHPATPAEPAHECGALLARRHETRTWNLLSKVLATTGLEADFAPRHYRTHARRDQRASVCTMSYNSLKVVTGRPTARVGEWATARGPPFRNTGCATPRRPSAIRVPSPESRRPASQRLPI